MQSWLSVRIRVREWGGSVFIMESDGVKYYCSIETGNCIAIQ